MMLRTKLILVFALVLALVVGMSGLLFWGTRTIQQTYERGLTAHDVLEAYTRLSNDAYRHFKQLLDRLVLGAPLEADALREGEARLRGELETLTQLTRREVALYGRDEPEEIEELEQIERLGGVIERGIGLLVEAQALQDEGREAVARQTLIRALDNLIDREFAALIGAAIGEEQREATVADRDAASLARTLALVAAIFALVAIAVVAASGLWLLRSIKAPLDRLMQGTHEIAIGRLGHRVDAHGPAEFEHLALSFNRMAAELEQQQSQLLRARTDLERKVRERTRELEQANVALQRLDQVRRRMFAEISHELRTPLTVIRGEAEVALRSRSVALEEYRASLERIVNLTGQLARLVEDLMVLARSESAAVRLSFDKTRLDQVLASVCEDAKVLAAEKGVAVVWQIPDEGMPLRADPERLRQLFLILVDNACRYTERGRITVELAREAGYAVVTVRDTGFGVPAEELSAVFDRFFRGSRAQKSVPRGAGLGLHVAKAIVDAHGGEIELSSEPGEGTEVKVRLPLNEARDPGHERLAG
jgi:two-component system OmpR family sensor kinase